MKDQDKDLSVGQKYDHGKVRTELLSPIAMEKIAEVLTFGANKYEDHNWRKGIKWSRVIGAMLRHIYAYMRGERIDPETKLSHMAHVGCCVMFMLEYEEVRQDFDDLYDYESKKHREEEVPNIPKIMLPNEAYPKSSTGHID